MSRKTKKEIDIEPEEFEVDSSSIFRQEAKGLTKVKDFESTLNTFGYSKDDRIERRELVKMYNSVQTAMDKEIYNLAHSSCYDSAKEMRSRLKNLRGEFVNLQTSSVQKMTIDQSGHFEQAMNEIRETERIKHESQRKEVEDYCERKRQDREMAHQIQQENLELEISRIPVPLMKFSKRTIELLKAEDYLIKLQQYEDARKVRQMTDKRLPREEKEYYDEFLATLDKKREKLKKFQAEDRARLEEYLKTIEWKDIRRRELEDSITEQRFRNNHRDMVHAHSLQTRLLPEMSSKPSALWQKREGYQKTSSALRGQQLLTVARGKHQGDQHFDDALVDRHNFLAPLQDTIVMKQPYSR